MNHKPVLAALALALSATAMPAFADAAPDPLSFNVSLTTDYRYRGISQTRLKPALQGGADYAAPNGFYIGTWASTIKWIKDGGGDAPVELDVYAGYKTELAKDLALDVGVLQYYYNKNKLNPSANTLEVYGALTAGPITAKLSLSTSNLFGFADSKNSAYLDISGNFDLGDGMTLTPHVGHQSVRHGKAYSYTDYGLTLAKDVGNGVVISGAVIGTDTDAYVGPSSKNLGKAGLVLAVKKSF
ncbi:TorF family putative porin [Pelomonas sp. SE-A7]|uniref:TorF family putative porin n=1 Tax=Pelomonas sp. SE-A7 TaxID=3054953 RepID=UPI00259C99DB|nr:TorF family putative porin [Pelomonas sp. SE-A7]MDM4768316.1 TorF family putative porin [Pelomonas sp. SE-A7]